ncbi:ATP synthase F1 subunit delta [Mycoplasmopsis alligatoris]|uniref:ATP synthase subunit delta n=1 Tax=Mycoplasmopsis alligatoris A21JP2 TaxID=747682 RepID=D4XVQ6_9BACT|nr:ATP synthase F1 subunit delta [Mycoplasmopsis alligatoris]EFF41573.1 ATP synthase F1, delta subunit [Mycoplasmopsis alligatoris A21JP2]
MYVKANPVGYAIAFYDLVKEKNDFSLIHNQVNELKDVIAQNKDLILFLSAKSITLDQKYELVDQIFAQYDKRLINLIKVVVQRNNANELKHILIHYLRLSNTELNIKFARVLTAQKLTKVQLEKIKTKLENLYNQKFEIRNEINEELISGYQIHLGSEIIEKNINNDLEKIKNTIINEKGGINGK